MQVVSDLVPKDQALVNGQSHSGGALEAPPAQLQLAAAWQVSAHHASVSTWIQMAHVTQRVTDVHAMMERVL